MTDRKQLKDKKRIVIKVGSSTITYPETGTINYAKLEKLVRIIADIRNMGKEAVLVSSGAIAVGRHAIGLNEKPKTLSCKQACAAIGQAALMTVYKKLFSEYNYNCAQILLTKYTFMQDESYMNACNTLNELLSMGVIPIVNENDTVSTAEIEIGDNDSLSAYVSSMIHGDLLILLSDIDGLYTDDPRHNKNAEFISVVEKLDDNIFEMAKGAGSDVGTGGMHTKIHAALMATKSGTDMVIINGDDVENIRAVMNGEEKGTLFVANKDDNFDFRKL
ncbi:MAG: glutamate 5-kinase [Lachnospiraceae bacterium]|nr:glutamate 5-kinase [Lachnospiraceae bacterium]